MTDPFSRRVSFEESGLHAKMQQGGYCLYELVLEITRRCNNNCRHCYINLPAQDHEARQKELDLPELQRIARQAVDLGAAWCVITGGEPLIRPDFEAIYLMLKREGLMVSVSTNACFVDERHIALWKKYPPRDIEVSVYGVSAETYEAVTRIPGSFKAFMRGRELLRAHGIKVRFKAMAMRSTFKEMQQIADFCRQRTKDYFRFDASIHCRLDGDPLRNAENRSERLTPEEIVALEAADPERSAALQKGCNSLIDSGAQKVDGEHLFRCEIGYRSFVVSPEGQFRLCPSLTPSALTCDLRTHTLKEAWEKIALSVRNMRSRNPEFLTRCRQCSIAHLCLWCPAHAYLETGKLDEPVEDFCRVAHARAKALNQKG